ncbi:MAG: ATP-binding cassette domain-containing protein [Micrococcus sp.]|nr:ATP-binding cassette domain-containing protein [Micrococcus sp.]
MITFEHVGMTFPDGTVAVEDFSLSVAQHQTVVLLGSSGCGKTTLLQMVNRMVDPTAGRVLVDGQDVSGVDPVRLRRRIGYVMQNAGLLPHRTVLDNVLTVPRLAGRTTGEQTNRAHGLLEMVGLNSALARRYPAQLSGGQRQRVGVARALAADPDILLMDEPFSAVDPVVRADLQAELLRIQRELAKTILFITHDVDEAVLLGDQVLVLQAGAHVAQRGTGEEILLNPANEFVRGFVGGDRRRLHVEDRAGTATVVDASGRVAGTLVDP